jgi:hypothetical protein
MSSDDIFRYANLAKGSIRLLHPQSDAQPKVTYKLTDHVLSKNLDYDALSYSWGTEEETHTITCNGSPVAVKPHLYEALKCIHQPASQGLRPIWIDAVCINQQHNEEKQEQFQLMGHVYRFAHKVSIWLGSSTEDEVAAISRIPAIVNNLRVITSQITINTPSLIQLSLPAINDRIWSSFGKLFQRSWFERLWTVQEMALAQELIFFCGTSTIDGSDMIDLAESLRRTGLVALTRGSNIPRAGTTDGYHFPTLIRRFTETRTDGKSVPLDLLLQLIRSRQATEPIDMVYGVLGLAEGRIREELNTIPYTETLKGDYHELYIAVAKICLREYPEFRLLSILPSIISHPKLPSWCPNLTSEPEASPFFYEYYSSGTSRQVQKTATPGFSQMLRFSGNVMIVQGWFIGKIEKRANSSEKWDSEQRMPHDWSNHIRYTAEWMVECLSLAQEVTGQNAVVPEAYLRTIIADIFDAKPGEDLDVLREAYRLFTLYRASLDDPSLAPLNPREWLLVARFLDSVFHAARSRRMFTTGNRLCLGPDKVQIGDVIVVFPKANMPFVLRGTETDGVYRLLGPAYVRGLMQGQVFDLADSGEAEKRTFKIVS